MYDSALHRAGKFCDHQYTTSLPHVQVTVAPDTQDIPKICQCHECSPPASQQHARVRVLLLKLHFSLDRRDHVRELCIKSEEVVKTLQVSNRKRVVRSGGA